jgi:hypothetical protein
MNYSNHTKGSASRGAVAPPFYMMGNVETEYPRMVVPQPGGIYNLYAPHNKEASFTNSGIRQWNSASKPGPFGVANFGGGNVSVPTKCKYDPTKRILDEQAETRETEFLGRYITTNEQARELLRETFAQKYGNADNEMVQMYMMHGATEAQAKEMVEKERLTKFTASKYKNRVANHVSAKNIIHDIAQSRGLHIGLPGSLATFHGVTQPQINYSGKEVAGIKRVLDASIKKVDDDRAKESMIGQKLPTVSGYGSEGAKTPAFADRYDLFLRERLADEVEREAGAMFNDDEGEALARLLGVHADRPNRANIQLQTGGGIGADNAMAGAGGAGRGVVPGRAGRPPGGGVIGLPENYTAYEVERATRANKTAYDERILNLLGIEIPPAGTQGRKAILKAGREQIKAMLG